jgi:hypothetical protein
MRPQHGELFSRGGGRNGWHAPVTRNHGALMMLISRVLLLAHLTGRGRKTPPTMRVMEASRPRPPPRLCFTQLRTCGQALTLIRSCSALTAISPHSQPFDRRV